MIGIKVNGGSNAGCKFPPKEQPKLAWVCQKGHSNRSYAASCMGPGCNERRDG